MAGYIGIDIGGTKIAVSLWETGIAAAPAEPRMHARTEFATRSVDGPVAAVDRLIGVCRSYVEEAAAIDGAVRAIGVSCGGPLDRDTGVIHSPPNLPGWDSVPIVAKLEDALGLPVALDNDANAGALAEHRYGAARGFDNVVFLTFGTGLGAGLILNGRLYPGANGMAGEIGHVRLEQTGPVGYGKNGSAEGFCSGSGIALLGREAATAAFAEGRSVAYCTGPHALDDVDAASIADAARGGDSAAIAVYTQSGRQLGRVLAILIDILNPEVIVIGSVFVRAHDLLWPEAEAVLRAESLAQANRACRVVPAALGDRIGDYAALAVALGGYPSSEGAVTMGTAESSHAVETRL